MRAGLVPLVLLLPILACTQSLDGSKFRPPPRDGGMDQEAGHDGGGEEHIDGGRRPSGVCGDHVCSRAEDTCGCAEDCGTRCGDLCCNGRESSASCPGDCGTRCGDGACNGDEDSASCPADCGTDCGDGVCNGAEDACGCPDDCPPTCQEDRKCCGDGMCCPDEKHSCQWDCEHHD